MASIHRGDDNNYMPMPGSEQALAAVAPSQPLLGRYKSNKTLSKSIFQITTEELKLFFEKKNMKKPDNDGEARISLNILREVNYNPGLCRRLCSDPETGIVGDEKDLRRRQAVFGKHAIALP